MKLIDKLSDVLNAEATEVLTVDGVKAILDDDSWILVRPSNTENAIRISVESTPSKAQLLFNKTEERVLGEYDQLK
jgi:phosphomannomutase